MFGKKKKAKKPTTWTVFDTRRGKTFAKKK